MSEKIRVDTRIFGKAAPDQTRSSAANTRKRDRESRLKVSRVFATHAPYPRQKQQQLQQNAVVPSIDYPFRLSSDAKKNANLLSTACQKADAACH